MDPDLRKCLDIKDAKLEELFLTGPTRWVDSEEGEMVALSVGSIDGKPHKEAAATMSSLAVRTATGSSVFQSQRSHPNFSATQLASQPASQPTSATQSRPQSKASTSPPTQMQAPPPNAAQPGLQQPLQAPQMQPQQMQPQQMQPPTGPSQQQMPQQPFQALQMQPQQMQPPMGPPQQQMPPPMGPPQPASQPAVAPGSESNLPNGSGMKSQPATFDGTNEIQNGGAGPPKSINMPPPQLSRMETQYMTPATEPSELKNFQ
ncbi:MAG: hypothetical protein Q9226_009152 [Calogaya cf. arnoldii]